jgi:hypothetical protein
MECALVVLVIFAAINLLVIVLPRLRGVRGSQGASRGGGGPTKHTPGVRKLPAAATYVHVLLDRRPRPLILKSVHKDAERKQTRRDIERNAASTVKCNAGSE